MRTKIPVLAAALVIALGSASALRGADRLELKLRVYEGARQGSLTPPKFVTSSYLQPTITANLPTGAELEKEIEQIKRVFNLPDVGLLTEADLVIGEGGQAPDRVRHYFRLNGSAYTVQVVLADTKSRNRFVVVFNEMVGEEPKNVLTTEMILTGGHSAVFGFENRAGKPYFCSFRVTGPAGLVPPSPPPPPPPPQLPPEKKKLIEDMEKGAVKITNTMTPPRLVKIVEPVYPEPARKEGLQGGVYLNVRTDVLGNVKQVLVIVSSNKAFEEAAIHAVRQWKYEPFLQDGQAREAVFSVTVRFAL